MRSAAIVIMLAMTQLAVASPVQKNTAIDKYIREITAALNKVKAEYKALEDRFAAKCAELAKCKQECEKKCKQICEQYEKRLREAYKQRDEARSKLASTTAERDRLKAEVAALKRRLADAEKSRDYYRNEIKLFQQAHRRLMSVR